MPDVLGMDKAVTNAMCTEDSYSYTRIKDTYSTSICTLSESLITALTQLVSVVVGADSGFIPLHACGVTQSSGAARNSTMQFVQSVMALATTQINGNPRHSRVHVVDRSDADGSRSGRM